MLIDYLSSAPFLQMRMTVASLVPPIQLPVAIQYVGPAVIEVCVYVCIITRSIIIL